MYEILVWFAVGFVLSVLLLAVLAAVSGFRR